MGVATGCDFKEIYRFPHTTYPYSSCICPFFSAASLLLFHFVKMILRSLVNIGQYMNLLCSVYSFFTVIL